MKGANFSFVAVQVKCLKNEVTKFGSALTTKSYTRLMFLAWAINYYCLRLRNKNENMNVSTSALTQYIKGYDELWKRADDLRMSVSGHATYITLAVNMTTSTINQWVSLTINESFRSIRQHNQSRYQISHTTVTHVHVVWSVQSMIPMTLVGWWHGTHL